MNGTGEEACTINAKRHKGVGRIVEGGFLRGRDKPGKRVGSIEASFAGSYPLCWDQKPDIGLQVCTRDLAPGTDSRSPIAGQALLSVRGLMFPYPKETSRLLTSSVG